MTELVAATEKALKAVKPTDAEAGVAEAMLALARKIDAWDVIVDYALDDLAGKPKTSRPTVPQNDNVSISAYLKYCESLGMTRKVPVEKKQPEAKTSGLASVSNIPRPTG
jgi:hypothetical protein